MYVCMYVRTYEYIMPGSSVSTSDYVDVADGLESLREERIIPGSIWKV
jgi:hypothetical protein